MRLYARTQIVSVKIPDNTQYGLLIVDPHWSKYGLVSLVRFISQSTQLLMELVGIAGSMVLPFGSRAPPVPIQTTNCRPVAAAVRSRREEAPREVCS
jgi:hypothetical protein